jgi:flagellar biosynthesis/type III secretory pathway M-ring protein FliF/YscJ
MMMSVVMSLFLSVVMSVIVVMIMIVMVVVIVMMVLVIVMMLVPRLFRVRPLERPAVLEDTEAGPLEAAARGLADLDRDSGEAEPGDDVGEDLDRHAEVQTGAEEHVSRDAAAAIQVIVSHGGA